MSDPFRTWLPLAIFVLGSSAWLLFRPLHGAAEDQFAAIRGLSIVIAILLSAAVAFFGLHRRRRVAIGTATLLFSLAAVGLFLDKAAERACTTNYNGATAIIGQELTEQGERHLKQTPGGTPESLLLDAGGNAYKVWKSQSVDLCWWKVFAAEALWPASLIAGLFLLLQTFAGYPLLRYRPSPGRVEAPGKPSSASPRYDAFISYRHSDADREFAGNLARLLEEAGYRVAIDERDFQAQESFLDEIERCIVQSRFTLAVISANYVESGACHEEAVISKVLGITDRRQRLVPLILQKVTLPGWLYGTVGVDFTTTDPLVDPMEKLKQTLGPPMKA